MGKYINILSLACATILMTACATDDTTESITNEKESYSISGDVKGCVEDADNLPVVGAEVSTGNVSGVTDNDGCYSLSVTLTTIKSSATSATVYAPQNVVVTHERFQETTMTFTPTTNIYAGVMYDLGTYPLNTDAVDPKDDGILDTPYVNNMLIEGINGSTKPFEIQLSEYINLATDIDSDTLIEILDENQTSISSSITAEVSFDAQTNVLSVTTSEAISSGYYVKVRIPSESITDVGENEIIAGVDAIVEPYGVSLTDYWTFNVRIFAQSDLSAEAVSSFSQMDEDSGLDTDEVYSDLFTTLETANTAFNNAVKYDENNVNANTISSFNSGGATTAARMQALADAYISDPTAATTTVNADILRVIFTPTNADHYIVKAYDENNVSVAFTGVIEAVNANTTITAGKVEVSTKDSVIDDIELALSGLDGSIISTVAVVPYSAGGTAGVANTITVKDNVAPTTSLQYSYGGSDDTSSLVSGGVVTSVLYGGSGETSNPEDITTPTVLTIGTPFLEMTNNLLIDQDLLNQNTGNFVLASPYTSSDYTTWTSNSGRSIGIGFTEAININGNATLTKSDSTTSSLITATINTVDNLPVTSTFTALTEDIAIFTVSNIFTLVNEHNGSVIDLTSITTDLAGNNASSAKVVLIDKVAPYVVSADINSSDANNSTITFSENIKAGSLDVGAVTCSVNDGNITNNVASLTGCALVGTGIQNIDFSLTPDSNGNFNTTHTFDTNVTN